MRRVVLYGLTAEVVGMAAFVAGWNLWQHFHDNGVTVGAGFRSVLRF
jgi:hypothetical protein